MGFGGGYRVEERLGQGGARFDGLFCWSMARGESLMVSEDRCATGYCIDEVGCCSRGVKTGDM